MEDKVQKLLQPRFEVIADYPGSVFNVGQILVQDESHEDDFWTGEQLYTDRYPKQYPHLFRPLSWWERRDPKLIEGVKYLMNKKTKEVHEVVEYSAMVGYMSGIRSEFKSATPEYSTSPFYEMRDVWIPCEESDYLTFINKKKV